MLQVLMEFLVDHPYWKNFVPDDTDLDNDGAISERELEAKFREYADAAFDIFDADASGSVTRDELRAPRFSLASAKTILRRAARAYPLKFWLKEVDIIIIIIVITSIIIVIIIIIIGGPEPERVPRPHGLPAPGLRLQVLRRRTAEVLRPTTVPWRGRPVGEVR